MTNYIKTTNFLAKDSLPDNDSDKIIKGSEFDTEFDNLQTSINSKANIISPALSGIPTAPTAMDGTSNTQIATTEFVSRNGVPSGAIIIWSGIASTIPTGWLLCDGTNSTPDLRDRFVVGATNSYAVNDTGGSKDATVVSHTHTGTTAGGGSHSHTGIYFPGSEDDNPDYGNSSVIVNNIGGASTTIASSGTGSVANHSHTFTTNSSGSSGTDKNLPPYYALYYIMKT